MSPQVKACVQLQHVLPKLLLSPSGKSFDAASFLRSTTISGLRDCASAGCSFCTILSASFDVHLVPEGELHKRGIDVRKSPLEPGAEFQLLVGATSVSRTFYERVPPEWALAKPSTLENPWDEATLTRTWLSNCARSHGECREADQGPPPRRLLDLESFGSSQEDIRLVEVLSLPSVPEYVALSHCWGPPAKRPICTNKSTLSSRMERIGFESLSLTFQDAVCVCRKLDQRYLWIDSLCIVQDDGDDWNDQASAMASIYGGAYVTLCALSSSDSTQGCRIHPKNPQAGVISTFEDFTMDKEVVRLFDFEPAQWHGEYGDDPYGIGFWGDHPLRTRAWTLQERELSTRCIHFARGQLLWECKTMKGSSELPWRVSSPDHGDPMPIPLRTVRDENLAAGSLAYQRDRWYGLSEDYSSRFLTEEDDKLPALAGLASRYLSEHDSGEYLAGVWSNHLPSALLWRTVRPDSRAEYGHPNPLAAFMPRRPLLYRGPTWSWVSIDGEISYESQRTEFGSQTHAADTFYGDFAVTGSYYQPSAEFDPLGMPSDATLRMTGRLAQFQVDVRPILYNHRESHCLLVTPDGRWSGVLYLDILDDFRGGQSVYVLSMRTEAHMPLRSVPADIGSDNYTPEEAAGMIMGLALRRARSGHVYRRVGLVRWLSKVCFEQVKPIVLRIV